MSHIDINGANQTFNNINPQVTVNLGPASTVNIALIGRYSISGDAFIDYDLSGHMNNTNTALANAGTVTITRNADGTQVYNAAIGNSGAYATPENLVSGSYTVKFTESNALTASYAQTVPAPPTTSWTVTVGQNNTTCATGGSPDASCVNNSFGIAGSIQNLNFGLTPLYSISGRLYNDINLSDYYTPGVDTPAVGPLTLNGPRNTNTAVTVHADGTYSATGLVLGQYTLNIGLPTAYHYVYPPDGTEIITVGRPGIPTINPCNPDNGHDSDNPTDLTLHIPSTCDANGDVTGLNFGMSNEYSWWQGGCTDVLFDAGVTDQVPNNGTCGGVTNQYALIPGSQCVSNPGIVYTGNTYADFGQTGGSASSTNQVVGGSAYPALWTPANPGTIRDSYEYVMDSIKANNEPTIQLSAYCTTNPQYPGACQLPLDLPSGIYENTGDITLVGPYMFPQARSFIILNNGKLTFTGGNFLVPTQSSVLFATTGDMHVDPSIGNTDPTSQNTNLMGFFVTDRSFIIDTATTTEKCNADGSPIDKRLNIIGSVITNAGNTGGTFQNNRDLCGQDLYCPTVGGGDGGGTGSGSGEGYSGGGSSGGGGVGSVCTMDKDCQAALACNSGGNGCTCQTGGRPGSCPTNWSVGTLPAGSGFSMLLYLPQILKHPNTSWQEVPATR